MPFSSTRIDFEQPISDFRIEFDEGFLPVIHVGHGCSLTNGFACLTRTGSKENHLDACGFLPGFYELQQLISSFAIFPIPMKPIH